MNASNFAKHAVRVNTIAKREIDNSEDPSFSSKIEENRAALEKGIDCRLNLCLLIYNHLLTVIVKLLLLD